MLIQAFVYLQVLDFVTTLLGFRLGASEASPFVRSLLQFGPAVGVGLSKLLAFTLAGICIWRKKNRIIGWINYWYAGLVLWNLFIIMKLLSAVAPA